MDCLNTSTPRTSDTISSVSYAMRGGGGTYSVEICVEEGDMVVAGDQVAQRGQTLVDSLDDDAVGQGVTEVAELVV